MSSTSDYVYISFADNFPVNLYSVAISVTYTNNSTLYPNHVLIATSDPTKVKDMVKTMVNISPAGSPPLIKIELPKLVLNRSIINGSEILLLPNMASYKLPAIKGRLILNKQYVTPSIGDRSFDTNGFLHFINDSL